MRLLAFARHSGLLVGAVGARRVDVWDLRTLALCASAELPADVVALAAVPGRAFFFAGCADGALRVLEAKRRTGGVCEARILPYCVSHAEATGTRAGGEGEGERQDSFGGRRALVAVRPQPGAEHRRLLLAYADCSLVAWDVPSQRAAAAGEVPPPPEAVIAGARAGDEFAIARIADLAQTLRLTDAEWIPGAPGLAVAGYSAGDVWLWALAHPLSAVLSEAAPATPLRRLSLHDGAVPRHCAPVVRVRATASSRRGVAWVYALGGQPEDEMEAITAVPVLLGGSDTTSAAGTPSPASDPATPKTPTAQVPATASQSESEAGTPLAETEAAAATPIVLPEPHRLVWFGAVNDLAVTCEAGPSGSAAVSSVITLTEGGQLHVHDEGKTTALGAAVGAAPHSPPRAHQARELDAMLANLSPGQRAAAQSLCEDEESGEDSSPLAAGVTAAHDDARAPSPPPPSVPVALIPALASPMTALGVYTLDVRNSACGLGVEALMDAGEFQGLPAAELGSGLAWPVTGGVAAEQLPSAAAVCESRLLVTGHRDGACQFWSADGRVVSVAPNAADVGMDDLAAVSCVHLCPRSGVLIVGYQDGVVRVFLYSEDARIFRRARIGEQNGTRPLADGGERDGSDGGVPQNGPAIEEEDITTMPGFQFIASLHAHRQAVRCAAVAGAAGVVATGDEANIFVVTDLSNGRVLFKSTFGQQGIAALRLAPAPEGARAPKQSGTPTSEAALSPASEGASEGADASSDDPLEAERQHLAVYALSGDGLAVCVGVLGGGTEPVGTITPKASGAGRELEVLDLEGRPIRAPAGVPPLRWMRSEGSCGGADGAASSRLLASSHGEAENMEAVPSFVLLVTHGVARLYAAKEIVGTAGKGSALIKAAAPDGEVWQWAALAAPPEEMSLAHGPCVVARTSAGVLRVIGAPGMADLGSWPLSEALGLTDPPAVDAMAMDAATGALALAAAEDGLHVLEVFAAAPRLRAPTLFDGDAAVAGSAAEAAASAASAEAAANAQARAEKTISSRRQQAEAVKAAEKRRGFFGRLKDKMSGPAKRTSSSGAPSPATVEADLADVLGATTLNEGEAQREAAAAEATRREADRRAAAAAAQAQQRHELIDAGVPPRRSSGGSGPGGTKTADEIREAYGRPRKAAQGQAEGVQSVLGEAQARLAERGERLSRIEQRTQQMEDDAANFADLAKQLAAKQKGGGWW